MEECETTVGTSKILQVQYEEICFGHNKDADGMRGGKIEPLKFASSRGRGGSRLGCVG